ncbi:hypothetical protein MMC13_007337 [Lambiella insularis]|nr:hypothetical protein [Lambiella insularis]
MYLPKSLLLAASLLATALAQSIQITRYPNEGAVGGEPTVIGWTGGDGSSTITILLKSGSTTISTLLQRNGQASAFTWTPSAALPNGEYSLEISQGASVYDTPSFALTGGSGVVTQTAPSTNPTPSTQASTTPTSTTTASSTPTTIVVAPTTATPASTSPSASASSATTLSTTTNTASTSPAAPSLLSTTSPLSSTLPSATTSTTLLSATTTALVSSPATTTTPTTVASSSHSITPASGTTRLAGSVALMLGAGAGVVALVLG